MKRLIILFTLACVYNAGAELDRREFLPTAALVCLTGFSLMVSPSTLRENPPARMAATGPAEEKFYRLKAPTDDTQQSLGLEAFGQAMRRLTLEKGLFKNPRDAETARWEMQRRIWRQIEARKAAMPPGQPYLLPVEVGITGSNGRELTIPVQFEVVRAVSPLGPPDARREFSSIRLVGENNNGFGVTYQVTDNPFRALTPPATKEQRALGLDTLGRGIRQLAMDQGLFPTMSEAELARWALQNKVWQEIITRKDDMPPGVPVLIETQASLVGKDGRKLVVPVKLEVTRAAQPLGPPQELREFESIRIVAETNGSFGFNYRLLPASSNGVVTVRFPKVER